jgi:hypothetical protein
MITGSFFDLPHVFIVFHPGSGGNFVSGIFDKIIHNDSSSLPISYNGSSHTVSTPYMSFGLTPDEQVLFDNRESREQYYLKQIKREYKDTNSTLVVWSHDFSNIEFYKKYFKNCKIVCITATSKEEMISSVFMNINKMMLADPSEWPVHPEIKKFRSNRLEKWTKFTLSKMIKSEYTDSIDMMYAIRNNSQYNAVVKLATMHLLLTQLGLIHHIRPNQEIGHEMFNHVFYPNTNPSLNTQYIIGPHVNNYISLADVSLPYNYLATHNVDLLVSTVSTVLERELSQNDMEFIHSSFAKYISSQNSLVLSDPIQYYNTVKEECSNFIISN